MSGYLRSFSSGFLWKGKFHRSHSWSKLLVTPKIYVFAIPACIMLFSNYLWYFGCKGYTCWKHYLIQNDSAITNLPKTTNIVNVFKVEFCKAKNLMSIIWHSGLGDHLCGKPLEYCFTVTECIALRCSENRLWSTCHTVIRILKSPVTLIKNIRMRFASPELNLKFHFFRRQVAILHPSGVLPSALIGLWFYSYLEYSNASTTDK